MKRSLLTGMVSWKYLRGETGLDGETNLGDWQLQLT